MKKVIMLAAVVAALASCQSKANKAAEAEADSIAIDTTYTLDMTYLDADGQGKDKTFTSAGKPQMIQKTVKNKKKSALKLTPNDGSEPVYFVIANDTTLTLSNDSLQEAVSDLNYDIVRVK